MSKIKAILLASVSAVLLSFSFPNPLSKSGYFLFAWVGLLPLFLALKNKNFKERFLTGYFAGGVFYAIVLYWLFRVSVPGAIVLILLLSLSFGLFGLFLPDRKWGRWHTFLYIPCLWVTIEFLRTYLFTGFPWALLGYSQHLNLPVIQIADITGSYGVSFLIVYANCVLYEVFTGRNKQKMAILAGAALVFAAVLFYGKYSLERPIVDEGLKVAVIQGNIPQHMKWNKGLKNDILERHVYLTERAAQEGSDLIVWPETSVPGVLGSETDLDDRLSLLAKSVQKALLVGAVTEAGDGYYNAAALISKNGKILTSYEKLHLVPFGEYVPLEGYFPFFRFLIDKPIGDFIPGREYTIFRFSTVRNMSRAGNNNGSIEKATAFYNFGTLICFEDIFPNLVRNFVKKGAGFMAVITNDAWFGKTPAAYQHSQASVFRAVENRVPFVRAANTGLSSIIDQKGNVLSSINTGGEELFTEGFTSSLIKPFCWRSIYTRFGDVFAWVSVFLFLHGLVIRR